MSYFGEIASGLQNTTTHAPPDVSETDGVGDAGHGEVDVGAPGALLAAGGRVVQAQLGEGPLQLLPLVRRGRRVVLTILADDFAVAVAGGRAGLLQDEVERPRELLLVGGDDHVGAVAVVLVVVAVAVVAVVRVVAAEGGDGE